MDRALIGRGTPIAINSLQFVLITQQRRMSQAKAGEINLQVVLGTVQLQSGNLRSSQFIERLLDAGDAQPFNADG